MVAPHRSKRRQRREAKKALICPAGIFPSSPVRKNIPLLVYPKSNPYSQPFRPARGALAIVTDVGRNAVDADAPLTNGA